MRARCNTPGATGYHRYGGRGIKVCSRWDDFQLFAADMGPKPSPKHTIERVDNDGPYDPFNCVWALPVQQSANQRLTPDRERARNPRKTGKPYKYERIL